MVLDGFGIVVLPSASPQDRSRWMATGPHRTCVGRNSQCTQPNGGECLMLVSQWPRAGLWHHPAGHDHTGGSGDNNM